jgi:hypothetical protein
MPVEEFSFNYEPVYYVCNIEKFIRSLSPLKVIKLTDNRMSWSFDPVSLHLYVKGKGKAVPLQVYSDPEGSKKLRFPYFIDNSTGWW